MCNAHYGVLHFRGMINRWIQPLPSSRGMQRLIAFGGLLLSLIDCEVKQKFLLLCGHDDLI